MPGLRKTEISKRILEILERSVARVIESSFADAADYLPWYLTIELSNRKIRDYSLYFWTVSHGGKSRSVDEYRIQTKLKADKELRVQDGTTLLLGYYHERVDASGRAVGNVPPEGMEVLVAWNALEHLRLGSSSSCQVSFEVMYDAYLTGKACTTRVLPENSRETVFAFRPEYLSSYLDAASGGHQRVQLASLRPAFW